LSDRMRKLPKTLKPTGRPLGRLRSLTEEEVRIDIQKKQEPRRENPIPVDLILRVSRLQLRIYERFSENRANDSVQRVAERIFGLHLGVVLRSS